MFTEESSDCHTRSIQIEVKAESLLKYSQKITLDNTSVLVHLGCYNKNILDWVGDKQQKSTSHNSGSWGVQDSGTKKFDVW